MKLQNVNLYLFKNKPETIGIDTIELLDVRHTAKKQKLIAIVKHNESIHRMRIDFKKGKYQLSMLSCVGYSLEINRIDFYLQEITLKLQTREV